MLRNGAASDNMFRLDATNRNLFGCYAVSNNMFIIVFRNNVSNKIMLGRHAINSLGANI